MKKDFRNCLRSFARRRGCKAGSKPWGKENVTLHYGEVPMGESVELLVLRKSLARELLPDGRIGAASSHPYYEVCTSPKLYDLVAALIRTKSTAAAIETARV
jgi:hypothetical protein